MLWSRLWLRQALVRHHRNVHLGIGSALTLPLWSVLWSVVLLQMIGHLRQLQGANALNQHFQSHIVVYGSRLAEIVLFTTYNILRLIVLNRHLLAPTMTKGILEESQMSVRYSIYVTKHGGCQILQHRDYRATIHYYLIQRHNSIQSNHFEFFCCTNSLHSCDIYSCDLNCTSDSYPCQVYSLTQLWSELQGTPIEDNVCQFIVFVLLLLPHSFS